MRHNTAKKIHATHSIVHKKAAAEIISFDASAHLTKIASGVAAACSLSCNTSTCDFEAFMQKYDMHPNGYFE